MTPLIWLLPWLLQPPSVMCELPAPVNVKVSPRFPHQLTWEPGPGSPEDVYYNVTVRRMESSWQLVAGCGHVVRPLVCDMTEAFSNYDDTYYNEVRAVLRDQASPPHRTEGFKPIQDATLGPPLVNVTACGGDLCVGLLPPEEGLRGLYDSLDYTLKVWRSNVDGFEFLKATRSLGGEVLQNLSPGREYCVAARIVKSTRRTNESPYSQPHQCATTAVLSADTHIWLILVCTIAPMVFSAVVVVVVALVRFLCPRMSLPKVLGSIEHFDVTRVRIVPEAASTKTLLSSMYEEAAPPTAESEEESEEDEGSDISGRKGRDSTHKDPSSSATSSGSAGVRICTLVRPAAVSSTGGQTGPKPVLSVSDPQSEPLRGADAASTSEDERGSSQNVNLFSVFSVTLSGLAAKAEPDPRVEVEVTAVCPVAEEGSSETLSLLALGTRWPPMEPAATHTAGSWGQRDEEEEEEEDMHTDYMKH